MNYNLFQIPHISYCKFLYKGRFVSLNSSQYERLQDLCAAIKANNHVKFIYRADDRLDSIYQITDKNSTDLADIVFMVGEKGNAFKNIMYDAHITEEHIKQLFETIKEVVVKNANNNRAVRSRIPHFKLDNDKFYHFFANEQSITKFSHLLSSKSAWMINDYYEMFLHGVGRNGINNQYSDMLSTTLDKNVANRFTNGKGIVYVGWVHDSGYITFNDMNKRNKEIDSLNLPTYKAVFPDQKEICLKYGLPPHNIIGYFIDDTHFVLNHHFLINQDNRNASLNNILRHGFYLDQSNFLQYLKKTKYVRGYDIVNKRYIH